MVAERGGAWRWRQGGGGSGSSTMVDLKCCGSCGRESFSSETPEYTNKNYYLQFQVINSDSELLTRICGTRYLKYQSIYNTGSIPGKKQLFPEKKQ
jgi:hypothetical protein